MIVECPNCQAKFRLPDEKVGPQGAKLRCGKCRHVFHVDAPQPAEPEGFADFDFPAESPVAPPPRAAVRPEPGRDDAAEVPPDFFHSESYEAPEQPAEEDEPEARDTRPVRPGFSLEDVADIPLPGSQLSKDRRRRAIIIGVSLLLVIAATLAAVYFLDLWPGKKAAKAPTEPPAATAPAKPEAEKPAPEAAAPAPKAEETAKVKDIMLQNVRQYYVSNEKAGQLFVIEGKAVNNFKSPKEMIKLEANLFDDKGATLAVQEELAGNTVSLFQLQVMTRDELKSALASQVGVLTNNTNIVPGGEAPFMIVFFDPPEAVKEFGVKVIDAKDPPKQ